MFFFILPEDRILDDNDIFHLRIMISCARVDVQTDKIHPGFRSETKFDTIYII